MFNDLKEFVLTFTKKHVRPTLAKIRILYYHWGGFAYFALFTLIKFVVWAVQEVTWRITGVEAHWQRAVSGKCYEQCAHVLSVVHSYRPSEMDKVRDKWHFLTVHHSFAHPDIVLRDDVILVDVTYKKAVFLQARQTMDKYTCKAAPFMFTQLTEDAVKLIEIPLECFHHLADKVGSPGKNYERITILYNMGRCGSTLVARLYEEADEDAIVFSEPPTFMEFYYFSNRGPKEFYRKALRSAVYLFFKPYCGKKRLFVKPVFFVSFIANDIQAFVPEAKCIFLHREPLRVILAHERAFGCSPFFVLLASLFNVKLWPHSTKFGFRRNAPLEHAYNKYMCATIFDAATILYVDLWWRYREYAEQFDYPNISYDILLENPAKFCLAILKLTEMPESKSKLEAAMSVLGKDSQEGTGMGQRALRNVQVTQYSDELKERTDKFLDELNFPRLDWSTYKNSANGGKEKQSIHSSSSTMLKPLPMQCVVSGGN